MPPLIARRVSVVIPVYNEDRNIAECLRRLAHALASEDHELLVCYDFDEDRTLAAIAAMPDKPPSVRLVKNDLGRGPAFAIRAGMAAATGDVVVVTMADLSDPPEIIRAMARKIRDEGAHVVSGSRYMPGGSQKGGPLLKRLGSRAAGLSLHWLAGVATHDATNNFRAYSREFLSKVPVQSEAGFELGLEMTVKAHVRGWNVAEVPSTWEDRTAGESRFRILKWLPHYLKWYAVAMAAPIGIVLLAFALRMVQASLTEVLTTDASSYLFAAQDLTQGTWKTWMGHGIHPGYPVAIAAAHSLIGDWERAGYLVSALAGALAVAPFLALAMDVTGRRAGMLAALLFACAPYYAQAHADVMTEGLFHLFFISAISLAWFGVMRGSAGLTIASGLVGALAYYVRPEGIYVPIALVGIALMRRPFRWGVAGSAVAGAAVFVAAAMPLLNFQSSEF